MSYFLLTGLQAQNTTCGAPSGPMAPVGDPPICYPGYTVENTGALTQYYTFVAITPNMQVMLLPTVGTACSFPNTAITYTNLRLYRLGDCMTPIATGAVFFGLTVGDTYVWGCTMTPVDPICVWIAEACPSVLPSPLPEGLVGLHASRKESAVSLSWSIGTAGMWDSYEVQRSASDAVGYATVGSVRPEGSGQLSFTFEDGMQEDGPLFYRLLLHNADGTQTSEVVEVRPSETAQQLVSLYPNPSVGAPEITVWGDEEVRFRVISPTGTSSQDHPTEDLRRWMSDAAPGIYLILAEAGGARQCVKWVKAE